MSIRVTPREHEYARLAATLLPRREIARRLNVSVGTVNTTLRHVYEKLGVHSRRELAPLIPTLHVERIKTGGRVSSLGLKPGDAVRVTGGRFAGCAGTYVSWHNGMTVRIQIGGGRFSITRRYVEKAVPASKIPEEVAA